MFLFKSDRDALKYNALSIFMVAMCSLLLWITYWHGNEVMSDVGKSIVLTISLIVLMLDAYFLVRLAILLATENPDRYSPKHYRSRLYSTGITIIMLVVVFACLTAVFGIKDTALPDHQITILDRVYFSIITFCTVGYGDLVPASEAQRALSGLEAITGYLVLGVTVSAIINQAHYRRRR